MKNKSRMTVLGMVVAGLFLTAGLSLGSEVDVETQTIPAKATVQIAGENSREGFPLEDRIVSIKHEDYVLGMDDDPFDALCKDTV